MEAMNSCLASFLLAAMSTAPKEALEPLLDRLRPKLAHALPETGVRFSAGTACFPVDADEPDQLQAVADTRLYAAKETS